MLPRLRGYRVRQELIDLGNGAQSHRLAKVPVAELAAWDAKHDAVGREAARSSDRSSEEKESYVEVGKA